MHDKLYIVDKYLFPFGFYYNLFNDEELNEKFIFHFNYAEKPDTKIENMKNVGVWFYNDSKEFLQEFK